MPSPVPLRIRRLRRRGADYVHVGDLVDLLRVRARAYRRRADDLIEAAVSPDDPIDPEAEGLVPPVDEALACRMVAEELEQRADQLGGRPCVTGSPTNTSTPTPT